MRIDVVIMPIMKVTAVKVVEVDIAGFIIQNSLCYSQVKVKDDFLYIIDLTTSQNEILVYNCSVLFIIQPVFIGLVCQM